MAALIITGANGTFSYELPTEPESVYNIGGGDMCEISLPGETGLAERHCSVTCKTDGYVITDAGSEAGTMAGDRRVEAEYMEEGTVYTLGSVSVSITAAATAPTEAPAPAETAPATAPKQTAAKKVARRAGKGSALSLEELQAAAVMYNRNRNKASRVTNIVYIVLVLAAAFYAGIALNHWQKTGNCLPGIVADGE